MHVNFIYSGCSLGAPVGANGYQSVYVFICHISMYLQLFVLRIKSSNSIISFVVSKNTNVLIANGFGGSSEENYIPEILPELMYNSCARTW